MKLVVCLTLFFILRFSLAFHQTDYTVKIERYNILSHDKRYIVNPIFAKKYVTRYEVQYDLSWCFVQDLDATKLNLHVEGRKFQSNEYRLFPFNFTENTCASFKFPRFGDFLELYDTNFKPSCDIKKGCYYIKNMYIKDSEYPPYAPRGRYKIILHQFYQKNILLIAYEFYIEIKARNPLERTVGV